MCPGRHMIAWSGRVTYIMTQPGPGLSLSYPPSGAVTKFNV